MKINHPLLLSTAIGVFILWSCFMKKAPEKINIKHVVVIGVDGMSPDGIQNAHTPMLDEMMKNGAYTFQARSVLPSSSSPNWASMLMGADTEQHGITSNGWERNKHVLPPVVSTSEGTFPTIFTLFNDQKPEAHVGAIYDWDGFGRLFEKNTVDFDIDGNHEDNTTLETVKYIKENKPEFTFVHLDHVDHAGHSIGHGTDAYYKSVEKADSLINQIIQSTKDAGIFKETLFLICADHGGLGFGHGGETVAEMHVPFFLYGAGIKKGYKIEEPVFQFDNAPTVAFAFGLKTPYAWIGRPVKGAFEGFEKPELIYKHKEQFIKPVILPQNGHHAPAGGLYIQKEGALKIQNPNSTGDIFYTLDGSDPTPENGIKYTSEVKITETSVVKAAIFIDDQLKSNISEGFFRILNSDESGVAYKVYSKEELKNLPDFKLLTPESKGSVYEFNLDSIPSFKNKSEHTAIVFESFIQIDNPGSYEFYTNSDDGSKLYINNQKIVDNDGDHGVQERSGGIGLKKGKHPIRVEYFNGGGGYHLDVQYKGPTVPKQIIPANKLVKE